MKTIKFNGTSFSLIYDVVKDVANIRITIAKEHHTLSEVAPVVDNCNNIQVVDENGEVIAIYNGYTKLVSLNIYDHYPYDFGSFMSVISIELQNVNVQEQIYTIQTEISDIEDTVDALTDSQETQDLAIEDLAEAVNDLTPEEE